MTGAADIDSGSRGIVGERDFDHGMTATGAITPRPALAVERAQPERVDRFVGESVTQEFDAQGATAALRASPKNSALHAHLVQRDAATGTDEFLEHWRTVDWIWPGMKAFLLWCVSVQ